MMRRLAALWMAVIVGLVLWPGEKQAGAELDLFTWRVIGGPLTNETAEGGCATYIRILVKELGYSDVWRIKARFQLVSPNFTAGPIGVYQDSGWVVSEAWSDDGLSHGYYFWGELRYPRGHLYTLRMTAKGETEGIRSDLGGWVPKRELNWDFPVQVGCELVTAATPQPRPPIPFNAEPGPPRGQNPIQGGS